ncbi:hypothetical protein EDD15DRAFT_2515387 [Pisolithus albus]|nr:hypothetical protein EDD15DRAFT_2515387 [Pisolithus albus]
MDMDHTLGLFPEYDTPRRYGIREVLRARTTQLQETIMHATSTIFVLGFPVTMNSFWSTVSRLITIGGVVERVPTNNGMRVISSSGGAARDTITVVRAREHHEYWQSAGRARVPFGGTNLRLPSSISLSSQVSHLLRSSTTTYTFDSATSRITLDAMATAFSSCVSILLQSWHHVVLEGIAMLGSYKLSQVQLLVGLHAIGCQGVALVIETERRASRSVTPNYLHGLVMSSTNSQLCLVRLMSLEPGADIAIRHATTRQEQ